jgi:hypothetical protein
MESSRLIIDAFLKAAHSKNDIKDALFKAAEAAQEEGWTYMEATFQLGEKAKDEGLSEEDSDSTIRRAFASDKEQRT